VRVSPYHGHTESDDPGVSFLGYGDYMATSDINARADEAFGAALRGAREASGLSQIQVAESMRERGFDFLQQTIYKIESSRRKVSVGEALALCEVVGVPLDTLVRRNSDTESARAFVARQTALNILDAAQEVAVLGSKGLALQYRLAEQVQLADDSIGESKPVLGGIEQTYSDYYLGLIEHVIFHDLHRGYENLMRDASLKSFYGDVGIKTPDDSPFRVGDGQH
jgi:transcriptional regulator with XRE-family HTH domain